MGSSFSTGTEFFGPLDQKSEGITWNYPYRYKFWKNFFIGIDLAFTEEKKGRRLVVASEDHLGRRVIINE